MGRCSKPLGNQKSTISVLRLVRINAAIKDLALKKSFLSPAFRIWKKIVFTQFGSKIRLENVNEKSEILIVFQRNSKVLVSVLRLYQWRLVTSWDVEAII